LLAQRHPLITSSGSDLEHFSLSAGEVARLSRDGGCERIDGPDPSRPVAGASDIPGLRFRAEHRFTVPKVDEKLSQRPVDLGVQTLELIEPSEGRTKSGVRTKKVPP
jgi:hypothetical protein